MIPNTSNDTGHVSNTHVSSLHVSSESLTSDLGVDTSSVISLAGQLNRRLGHLLGYSEASSSQQLLSSCDDALANITGYEIVCLRDNSKYTVSFFLIILNPRFFGTDANFNSDLQDSCHLSVIASWCLVYP